MLLHEMSHEIVSQEFHLVFVMRPESVEAREVQRPLLVHCCLFMLSKASYRGHLFSRVQGLCVRDDAGNRGCKARSFRSGRAREREDSKFRHGIKKKKALMNKHSSSTHEYGHHETSI